MDQLMELLEPLVSPQALHAITVHIPVALAIVGIPLVYAAAAIAASGNTLRWTACVAYLFLAGAAAVSVETGEGASARVPGSAPGAIWDVISQHEEMAEQVWIFALVTAACMLISTVNIVWLRKAGITLAMLASLATAGWVAFVGHLGGTLVYESGIGSPFHPILYREMPGGPVLEGITNLSGFQTPGAKAEEEKEDIVAIAIRDIDMDAAMAVSYRKTIKPLIEEACGECHSPFKDKGKLDMTSIEAMLLGGEKDGPSIVPGNPDESPLVLYCRGILKPQMPKGEPPLSEDELHLFRMWIAAGALDDAAAPTAESAAPAGPSPAGKPLTPEEQRLMDKWDVTPEMETVDDGKALEWLNNFPE